MRQQVPLGLGHAIWCARAFVGDDPFAILLPDDLMMCRDAPAIAQLADAYRETEGNVVAIDGSADGARQPLRRARCGEDNGRLVSVKGLVEKPAPDKAPSNLTIIGRYVLMPEVIGASGAAREGRGRRGATDRRHGQADRHPALPRRCAMRAGASTAATRLGFLEAQVAFALKRPDLAPAMREILKTYG